MKINFLKFILNFKNKDDLLILEKTEYKKKLMKTSKGQRKRI